MSTVAVAEPFLLSSYPESPAFRKRKAIPLFASLPSGSDADPYVTVAVQGDGVHVLDTSTLHSAVSHTLGPSVYFPCPPATRITQSKGSVRTCTTYAVLESGPDVQPDAKGKTIVAWEERITGGMSADSQSEKNKRAVVALHSVAHVYAPEYLQERVVLVSGTGEVSLADDELRVLRTCTPQNHQPSSLRKHFLFRGTSCSFLPSHVASTYAAVSVSFLRSGDIFRLNVVGLEGDNVTALGECVVHVEEPEILDISCSNCGFISVLSPSGTWAGLSLSTSPSSYLSVSAVSEPLRLYGLAFINSPRTSEVSLAALTSSHVLLAAVSSASPLEVLLLLWDLRYGVLLAQQSIAVPSTLPRPKKLGAVLKLEASPLPSSRASASKVSTVQLTAIVTLHPLPERELLGESNTQARSTILVVPLTVPSQSTIAAAMGKANAGTKWISNKSAPAGQGQGHDARGLPEMSAAARKALREIKAARDGSATGNPAIAENTFFEYVKQQSKGKGTAGDEQSLPMEYHFVQGVLEVVVRAPSAQGRGQSTTAYSSKIVKHLLESRAVSSSMVEDGLLPALAARHEWDMVALAMQTVSDLPENDIFALLSQVVAAHQRSSTAAADENAMQVDSAPVSASTPSPVLPAFLAQCVVYPCTPALQRTALRKHLPDAAAITALLGVLEGWLAQHTQNDALAPVPVPGPDAPPWATLPPLDKVLAFLQTVLDASFLALLAHAPAHRPLRAHLAYIEPALARTSELELLCGPLEPFARAAAAKARAQTETKESGKPESGRDWRRKRKLAHEQAGMAIGLYQVEELIL